MNKILNFVKKHFLTKKFLTFGIIGVANTGIDALIYYLVFWNIAQSAFWAKTAAFFAASIFSYFANVIFTFKPKKKSTVQFSIVMLVFGLRWLISAGLAVAFAFILESGFKIDFETHKLLSILPTFLASALLIPIAYFALDWVFKRTDEEKA